MASWLSTRNVLKQLQRSNTKVKINVHRSPGSKRRERTFRNWDPNSLSTMITGIGTLRSQFIELSSWLICKFSWHVVILSKEQLYLENCDVSGVTNFEGATFPDEEVVQKYEYGVHVGYPKLPHMGA